MNHAATYCEGKKCNICSRELWLVFITRAIPASELLLFALYVAVPMWACMCVCECVRACVWGESVLCV